MTNIAIIVGRLGADPEVRNTSNGTSVATFNVATTERWKDQNGIQQETTEWHRVLAWDKLADICGNYLRKGSLVYIEGRIKTRKWQDREGNSRHSTEIIAREMKMLDRREGGIESYRNDDPPSPSIHSIGDDLPF